MYINISHHNQSFHIPFHFTWMALLAWLLPPLSCAALSSSLFLFFFFFFYFSSWFIDKYTEWLCSSNLQVHSTQSQKQNSNKSIIYSSLNYIGFWHCLYKSYLIFTHPIHSLSRKKFVARIMEIHWIPIIQKQIQDW